MPEDGALDLDTLFIQEVVIHRIPKVKRGDKEDVVLDLKDAPIALTDKLKTFFRGRITRSLAKARFPAVYDKPAPVEDEEEHASDPAASLSAVPQAVVDYFKGGLSNLVETSQLMAKELYAQQSGSASEGMLVVIDARVGSGAKAGAVLAVLKLEDDEALMVTDSETADGKSTFTAQVQPVTLPEDSKVFKAALFRRATKLADIRAEVSDNQRDTNLYGQEVAEFFLKFLGCRLRDTADRATRAYLETAQSYINTIEDEEKKSRYLNAILADLDSESSQIDPAEVALKNFAPKDRDGFLKRLAAEDGSVPVITKDKTGLGGRTHSMTFEFEGGVKVYGPREAIEGILKKTDGVWTIDAALKSTSASGRR